MKRKYRVLLIILLWVLSVDQWTKHSIQSRLALHHTIPIVKGFFNLTHVRNPGGAFGVLGGVKGALGSALFLILSLVAIGVILVFFFKTKEHEDLLSLAFSLVLAGAIGNLIDRFRFGEVIDFLDFYLFSFHWPAFNIADSAICVGMGLIVLEIFLRDRKKKRV
ncbi:MAG: signal peptidase II [Thermodesulfobacteriota bacterium]